MEWPRLGATPDKTIQALGGLLHYGPIGRGLNVAVIAGIILLAAKHDSFGIKFTIWPHYCPVNIRTNSIGYRS